MIICPNCSNANPDASRFCNECGTRLSAPPPSAAARMPAQPAASAAPAPTSPAPPPELIAAAPVDPPPDPSSQRVAAPEPEGELPDWLRDLRQTGLTEMPEGQDAPADSPSSPTSTSASSEPAREALQPAPEPSPPVRTAQEARAESASPRAEARETDAPAPAGAMPQAAHAASAPSHSAAPSRLEELRESDEPATAPPLPAKPPQTSPLAARLAARASTRTAFEAVPSEAEEMPDWLRELRGAPEPQPVAPLPAPPPQADLPPAWLSDLRIEPVEIKVPLDPAPSLDRPSSADAGTPAAGSLPDWLKGLSEPQPAPAAAAPRETTPAPVSVPMIDEGTPPAELLAPAEIPEWVLELRPGATASPPADILERSGLLAGIRGALPVEPAVSMPHHWSPGPPVKAPLPLAGFAELHAPKPDALGSPPAPPAARRAGCLGRAGLPLLILFVISLAFLPFPNASDWRGAAIAAYQPSRDFYQTINHINGLQPDALALVAIDYGAQSRAELDPQARAVLSHLFQNKQRMILLSLVPEGGQLAQDLLAGRNPANSQFNYPYDYGQTHLNLGFQPGGEAALRQLAQGLTLRQIPDVRDQVPAANWPITQNWKSLDDVALIVIFSDDGAQVERWIEQVGVRPDLSTRTLLAGVNKASESFVMPYYESKQLKGLLAGTHGAAEYEGFLLQPASAAATLDGISYVVIVLVAVIVLSLAATALKRRVS